MKLQINCNELATVVLTRRGRQIFSKYAQSSFNCAEAAFLLKTCDPSLILPLWVLMSIFGSELDPRSDAEEPVFQDNIIRIGEK
jgi:hypothetical protein